MSISQNRLGLKILSILVFFKGLFTGDSGQDEKRNRTIFIPRLARGCLYRKWDQTKNGAGRLLSHLHMTIQQG